MALPNASAVRIFGAFQMGEAAARMRLGGFTPGGTAQAGTDEAAQHGAFQWADACQITDTSERRLFCQSFVNELERQRIGSTPTADDMRRLLTVLVSHDTSLDTFHAALAEARAMLGIPLRP